MLRAYFCLPGLDGWSGIAANQASTPDLKVSTDTPVNPLRYLGTKLNSLASLHYDFSLNLHTATTREINNIRKWVRANFSFAEIIDLLKITKSNILTVKDPANEDGKKLFKLPEYKWVKQCFPSEYE